MPLRDLVYAILEGQDGGHVHRARLGGLGARLVAGGVVLLDKLGMARAAADIAAMLESKLSG